MPVTFSPGEAETRPLHPKEIVYTTPQKVAELLGIGPSESVLSSADAVSDGVFVTGGDFRNVGFSVGDSILIYSDLDPMGTTLVISSIANGGASGVKLLTETSFTHGNFTTAANTYVENQASFTNGKTRGMKRSTVEARILEVQDKIDNITHNAWRPYLVNAEYINFDTYKPYRRRYYTDYVGTTPLLFRNVQQILKLEIWQGNTYRELAGAGCTLKIERNDTNGKFWEPIFLFGLPNGSCAKVGLKQSNPVFANTFAAVISPGTGYSNQSGITPTGGSGTGMTINTITSNGANRIVNVINKGTGYVEGDILTIPNGSGDSTFTIATFDSGVNDNTSISNNFQDKVHTHQDFADTINEEDRASKGPITFEPRFTLPGSTSNVTLKDEIMAVANSDYGNGVLKVTSMRQTKGGERNTVAVYSETQGTISDVVTKKGYARFAGSISSLSITTGGSGYSAGTLDATGGSFQFLSIDDPNGTPNTLSNNGKGVRVTVTVNGGVVDAITAINIPTSNDGQGFLVGDVIEFGNGGFTATVTGVHPNQSLSITNSSGIRLIGSPKLVPGVITIGTHVICVKQWDSSSTPFTDITFPLGPVSIPDTGNGHEYKQHTLRNDLGDFSDSTTVVVDNGVETVVNTPGVGSQARLGDWWLDHEMGIIYFNNSYPFFEWNAVKVSYIYGERYLEKAIEEAATKMVAADLLMSDDRSVLIPEGTQNVDLGAKIQLYRKEAEEILSRYKEMVVFA